MAAARVGADWRRHSCRYRRIRRARPRPRRTVTSQGGLESAEVVARYFLLLIITRYVRAPGPGFNHLRQHLHTSPTEALAVSTNVTFATHPSSSRLSGEQQQDSVWSRYCGVYPRLHLHICTSRWMRSMVLMQPRCRGSGTPGDLPVQRFRRRDACGRGDLHPDVESGLVPWWRPAISALPRHEGRCHAAARATSRHRRQCTDRLPPMGKQPLAPQGARGCS